MLFAGHPTSLVTRLAAPFFFPRVSSTTRAVGVRSYSRSATAGELSQAQRAFSSHGSTADDLTLSQLAARFAPVTTADRSDMLKQRLKGLSLARARVGPSLIAGAGQGLFANRDIEEGELVTLYPGDALLTQADDGQSYATVGGFAEGLRLPQTGAFDFSSPTWAYGVRISGTQAVVGNPAFVQDPAYFGHMANDALMCSAPGITASCYEAESTAAANVGLQISSMAACHLAVVALVSIRQSSELLLSYGSRYWLSKLPNPPRQFKFADGSQYWGEVRTDTPSMPRTDHVHRCGMA